MPRRMDLTGLKFGRWTVVTNRGTSPGRSALWECRCDCGTIRTVTSNTLRQGRSRSCGCLIHTKPSPAKDLTGQRFGRLLVVGRAANALYGGRMRPMWHCLCDCGKPHVTLGGSLRRGAAQSCGCLSLETLRRNAEAIRRHGHAARSVGRSPEYQTWGAMNDRCRNPNHSSYQNYGGRGITVCDRWSGAEGFCNFLADMGVKPSARHSIDRIDNDGPYAPGNCRWVTRRVQQNNMRSNRVVTEGGLTMTASQWARYLGVSASAVYGRIYSGRPVTAPYQPRPKRRPAAAE